MCVVREGEGVEVTRRRRAGQKEARYRLSPRFTCGVWRDLGEVEEGKRALHCIMHDPEAEPRQSAAKRSGQLLPLPHQSISTMRTA